MALTAQNLGMQKKRITDRRYFDEANRLREIREARGKSGSDFADLLGWQYKTYMANESGNKHVDIELAKAVRRVTGYPIDWIYMGDEGVLRADLLDELRNLRKFKAV